MSVTRLRRRMGMEQEAGFSLIEAVVAITLLALVMGGLSATLLLTLKGSQTARLNQNAIEVSDDKIEELRAIDVAAVAVKKGDPTLNDADSGLTPCGLNCYKYGGLDLVLADSGKPFKQKVASSSGSATVFTRKLYVTTPPTDAVIATAAYKIVTVVTSWTSGGKLHSRTTSTKVTATRRGLPLPKFDWQPNSSRLPAPGTAFTRTAGDNISLGATLTNQGARDRWDVAVTGGPAGWTWDLYLDADGDGIYDPSDPLEALLTDSDANGIVDTGLLEHNGVSKVVAYLHAPVSSTTPAVPYPLTVTATAPANTVNPLPLSIRQRSVVYTVTVVGAATAPPPVTSTGPSSNCTSCKTYWLHNGSSTPVANTSPASATMPMDGTAPVSAVVTPYDYDGDAASGRLLVAGGSTATTAVSQAALWELSAPSVSTYKGTGYAVVWVRATSTTGSAQLQAFVRAQTGKSGATPLWTGWTAAQTPDVTSFTGTWTKVTIPVPVPTAITVAKKAYALQLKITSASGVSVQLAYDTAAMPAGLYMPATSGG